MAKIISAKELRYALPDIVRRVRRGERYLVMYRSRPAFRLVPVSDGPDAIEGTSLADEPLYRAGPVGASTDGLASRDHDPVLYPRHPR